MLPHGDGDLVDRDHLDFTSMGGIGGLVEGRNHIVIKSPHGTGGRIDDQHPDDYPSKEQVAEIPTIDGGIQWDGLRDPLTGELHDVLGGLEVAIRGVEANGGWRGSRGHCHAVAFLQRKAGAGRIAGDRHGVGRLTDDTAAGGHAEADSSDSDTGNVSPHESEE